MQNSRTSPYLSLDTIERWKPLARERGVSKVARGPRGFLSAYKRAAGRPGNLSDAWKRQREAFIARHFAQVKQRGEPLWESSGKYQGLPTRRHLALIMWGWSPDAGALGHPRGGRVTAPIWGFIARGAVIIAGAVPAGIGYGYGSEWGRKLAEKQVKRSLTPGAAIEKVRGEMARRATGAPRVGARAAKSGRAQCRGSDGRFARCTTGGGRRRR